LNTLTFAYLSLTDDHAGFQGLGDEGWGVEKVEASATPLPPTWTMMLIGLWWFRLAYEAPSQEGNSVRWSHDSQQLASISSLIDGGAIVEADQITQHRAQSCDSPRPI